MRTDTAYLHFHNLLETTRVGQLERSEWEWAIGLCTAGYNFSLIDPD